MISSLTCRLCTLALHRWQLQPRACQLYHVSSQRLSALQIGLDHAARLERRADSATSLSTYTTGNAGSTGQHAGRPGADMLADDDSAMHVVVSHHLLLPQTPAVLPEEVPLLRELLISAAARSLTECCAGLHLLSRVQHKQIPCRRGTSIALPCNKSKRPAAEACRQHDLSALPSP